jgi:transposase
LTGGQAADCTAGAQLLERLPPCRVLHADKGYETDAIRRQVEDSGAAPNIPSKTTRRWKACFSPVLYRGRNAIERMFCRLNSAVSQTATIASQPTTSLLSASQPPSAIGYESGP